MRNTSLTPTEGGREGERERERKRERERIKIMIRMHKTIGKRRILYSNYNTQETNQKPKTKIFRKRD